MHLPCAQAHTDTPSAVQRQQSFLLSQHGSSECVRRLDAALDKLPACSTPRRGGGSSQRGRRRHKGPSASADLDTNKENRMQEWQCPGGRVKPLLKAKRKLYCGKPLSGTESGSRAWLGQGGSVKALLNVV